MVKTVEEIEEAITHLPAKHLMQFRSWYEKFDADAWDQQIESDISEGKLDALARIALDEFKEGKALGNK